MEKKSSYSSIFSKIAISIVLLMLGLFVSKCNMFFEPEEISIAQIENYDQLENAVGGVYGRLKLAVNSTDFYIITLLGDDMITSRGAGGSYDKYYGGNSCFRNNKNSIEDDILYKPEHTWETLYKTIASANNILSQYNLYEEEDQSIREILGEVVLIRAYCHFRLMRTYGQIPLIKNNNVDYTVSKASYEETYQFIENDLLLSIELLPENNIKSRVPFETPHSGTAKAMLAEVYLSWAGYPVNDKNKYSLAAIEAGELIDNASFYGFGLLDDFADLWQKENYYNNELVFSIFSIGSDKLPNYTYNSIYFGSGRGIGSYNVQGFATNPKICFRSLSYPATEINFYNNYPKDYRRDITFFNIIYVPNRSPYYPQIDTGYIFIDKVNSCCRVPYKKFYMDTILIPEIRDQWDIEFNSPFSFQIIGNQKIVLYRFAQTYLTYAEAAARSGQLDAKAYDCVNIIRRRANKVTLFTTSKFDMQPGLSPEEFADSVVWERAWELCGEPEGRWFDLVRLGKVEEVLNSRHPNEGGFPEYPIDKDDYYLPIPEGEIILNPSLGE